MQVVYEVPNRFRVLVMREFSPCAGSSKVIRRRTPVVMTFKPDAQSSAITQEWTESLFDTIKQLTPEQARSMNEHLDERYRVVPEMLEEVIKAPADLLSLAV